MDPINRELPLEIILHVIDAFVPDRPGVLLPQSHSSTKTLLAFSLVCRGTYSLATTYLRRHCAYLDSQSRLRNFLLCQTPSARNLQHVSSLYLAPFGSSLYDLPTAVLVHEILCAVAGTLTKLVIDMPLRSLWPADDHLNVRRTLREAFKRLTNLEEFVSVQDELFLRITDPEWGTRDVDVWTGWPRLRRMALYNPDAVLGFWHSVGEMPMLESLVLTRADALEESCMKSPYFSRTQRPLKVIIANVASDQPQMIPRGAWNTVDPCMKFHASFFNVPTSFYGDENPSELCKSWVRRAAIRGTLWDWQGSLLEGTTPPA